MDEEIRHLQRLALLNDQEAKDELFNLIRRLRLPPEFGLTVEIRPYRCTLCGHETTWATNHTGYVYAHCGGCSWRRMQDETGFYHPPSGRTFAYAGYELSAEFDREQSCNCPSCKSSESKYSRNPITPHRLYSVLYRAIWPTNDPGSSGEAEMARNLAVRFLKDVTVVDLPQLQGVLLKVWEGPAKQPGAFQKLRDIYDLAARTNRVLPTFLDVAAGVKPQTPRPSSPPPQPQAPPPSKSGPKTTPPPKSPPKPSTTSAPLKTPQPTSQATCRACDGRGYMVKVDRDNVLKETRTTCSRCGGSGFEPGPSKSKGGGRWRGGGSRQEETEDEKDVNRAADTFLKKYGFGKWGVKMGRYRNPDDEYRQLQREKEKGDPGAAAGPGAYRRYSPAQRNRRLRKILNLLFFENQTNG